MEELHADRAEEEAADHGDDVMASGGQSRLPIVGLGGSAGSLAALQKFFTATPADTGMAYVVIVHLAPDHESYLDALLQRTTAMAVLRVTGPTRVEPDRVYVISPGHSLQMKDGELSVAEPMHERGRRVAVDLFFRTLADTHGPKATAIVLSGGDSDGAIGIKRIKERGGLAIVQDPNEADEDSMPRAALATGMIDWVLPVADIPLRLVEYRRLERELKLPSETGPEVIEPRHSIDDAPEAALREVLAFLRARTGRDFSSYKRATTLRRIGRRMQVNGVDELPQYLDRLRTHPGEVGALLQDLLISVTNFFRDSRCFDALRTQVPQMFKDKAATDRVRVWVAACATGEEAYSIAMLLAEHASTLEAPPLIQVFATDLDELAIQAARSGLYPSTIEADVSPERLRRFFVKEHQGYRVRRELRETVLFSIHDLLRDSAFSRLDLVSCRNLLIYLTRAAQTRLFETFHFSLRPDARLFLGSSETIEDGDLLFAVVDKKHRIYARRPAARATLPVPVGPGELAAWSVAQSRGLPTQAIPGRSFEPPGPWRISRPADAGAATWADLHLKALERVAPPSVFVDAQHDVVHLSENAGRFLQLGGGEPTTNLLRLVHADLRMELRTALLQAAQLRAPAEIVKHGFDVGGAASDVTIRVTPVQDFAPDFLLVTFEARHAGPERDPRTAELPALEPSDNPLLSQLDREVERLNTRLRDTVEQYEASNEELKASNEELQAMNEELRSATEELETGREELQSINEELSAVNHELKSKVDELGSSNSDMLNLMDATSIPTVFLDRELRITRYTPAAIEVFNLIPSDLGRPLTDLRTELDFPTLGSDAARVLERLVPVEREISRADQSWYSARLLPYRTIEDRIGGIVLTLVDITERRRTEMALRASQERLRLMVENAREYAIFSTDPDGKITSWSSGAARLLGYAEADVLGRGADLIFTPEDRAAGVPEREMGTALATGRAADDRFHQRKDSSRFWASGTLMPMRDESGSVVGFVKILRDQTEARRVQEALERSRAELLQAWHENEHARREAELQKEHLAALFTQAPAPICIVRGPDYVVELANPHMCRLWGREADEVIGKPIFEAVPALRSEVFRGLLDSVMRTGTSHVGKEVPAGLDRHGNGSLEDGYLNFTYAPLRNVQGEIDGVLTIAFDVTDEIRAREQMSHLHATAEAASRAKDDFLAMLGHELRNPLAPLRTSLHLMRRGVPPDQADNVLDIAERQAGNLSRIVDDLLEAARIAEGKIELRLESIDMVESVRQALDATRESLASQKHDVAISLPKRPLRILADPVRIEQIVVNLVNNAGKYTPAGGRIEVTLKRTGKTAELRVADNGIGIPEDLRPRLFQLFQQGDRSLSREEGGLGVGLSVVRRLVELHGGSVEALSDGSGKGSAFVVRLPIATESAPAVEAPQAAPASAIARRILVVDDNRDAGDTLTMLLHSMGHETRFVTDGPSAVQASADWHPDVVFLDIGLPGMDGYEVAREIRLRQPGPMPRLVAVTGYGQDRDREKSRAAGFDEHLVKPAEVKAIVAIVESSGQSETGETE